MYAKTNTIFEAFFFGVISPPSREQTVDLGGDLYRDQIIRFAFVCISKQIGGGVAADGGARGAARARSTRGHRPLLHPTESVVRRRFMDG